MLGGGYGAAYSGLEDGTRPKKANLGLNDAIQSIRLMINQDIFSGELFNVVSSNNTVREIVELITESVPDVTVKFVDSLIMNQLSYEVLAHKLGALGFKPRDNLSTAIKEAVSALNGASRKGNLLSKTEMF